MRKEKPIVKLATLPPTTLNESSHPDPNCPTDKCSSWMGSYEGISTVSLLPLKGRTRRGN
jgi:hypothetical protein